MSPTNTAADLAEMAQRSGWTDNVAFYTDRRVWTHGEVHDAVARAATVLTGRGIRPGRRVLIALTDEIGWVIGFLATIHAGGTPVVVNPALTEVDHLFMVGDSEATLVLTNADLVERFDNGLVIDDLLAEATTAEPGVAVDNDEPLYMYYTSGTTGKPKGVLYRQGCLGVYHSLIGMSCFRMTPKDVSLSVSKLYFVYGFANTMVYPLFSGSASVLIKERPTPAMAEDLVRRYGVTQLYAVPSWYARLVTEADSSAFAGLRVAVSAGEPLTPDLATRTSDFLGTPLLNQLGASEIGCAIATNTVEYNAPGTVGHPVPGFQLQLRNSDGTPVPDGESGEVWVNGPVRMSGYLNRPEATADTLVDGWLALRDRAVRNSDGTFTHLGRVDDMELVGGINVSPLEVEEVLGTHDGVREVAVAAVPDRLGATKLRAFVVPSNGMPHDLLEIELLELAGEKLARFKVPRSVHVVDALPRTPSGKLQRFLLRQRSV
jgi:acyl-coenzyme A synthetase/AMP-(fatty) acid ligase